MVAQPLPITGRRGFEVSAASALVDASSSRADDEVRRAARRPAAGLRAAGGGAGARARAGGSARPPARLWRTCSPKREAAGDAAGLRSPSRRARGARRRRRSRRRGHRTRAGAGDAGGASSPMPSIRRGLVAVGRRRRRRPRCRRSRRWWSRRNRRAASCSPCARRSRRRGSRSGRPTAGVIPEPEIVAGTKSSTAGGGDIGQRDHACTPRCRCSIARGPNARWRDARAAQAEARLEAFRAGAARRRSPRSAPR